MLSSCGLFGKGLSQILFERNSFIQRIKNYYLVQCWLLLISSSLFAIIQKKIPKIFGKISLKNLLLMYDEHWRISYKFGDTTLFNPRYIKVVSQVCISFSIGLTNVLPLIDSFFTLESSNKALTSSKADKIFIPVSPSFDHIMEVKSLQRVPLNVTDGKRYQVRIESKRLVYDLQN